MIKIATESEKPKSGIPVIDVDGSYLVSKHQKLGKCSPLTLPSPPLTSWESIDDANFKEAAKKFQN